MNMLPEFKMYDPIDVMDAEVGALYKIKKVHMITRPMTEEQVEQQNMVGAAIILGFVDGNWITIKKKFQDENWKIQIPLTGGTFIVPPEVYTSWDLEFILGCYQ